MARPILNSTIITVSVTLLACFFGGLGGYYLSRTVTPFTRVVFILVGIALYMPYQTIIIPLTTITARTGLINSHLWLIMCYMIINIPLASVLAEATAVGVDAGLGDNHVLNSGVLNARAAAETIPNAYSNSDVERTLAVGYSSSTAKAWGILTGEGDNWVQNQGEMVVEAIAEKATPADVRTTAWTDAEAKVGTAKTDPRIKSSAFTSGISAGEGTHQVQRQ